MNLEDFHCDMLNLTFRFEVSEFNKPAFLKVVGAKDESELLDEDGDLVYHRSFASRQDVTKQHAHFHLVIFSSGKGRVDLDFHAPGPNPIEPTPPDLEDSAKWLGQFFNVDEVSARMDIAYEFKKEFESVIALPFPLVVSSQELSGLKVSGLSLKYPKESQMQRTILEVESGGTYLHMQKATQLKFQEFDLIEELQALEGTVNSFIRRRG
jgi:hypothetical protein